MIQCKHSPVFRPVSLVLVVVLTACGGASTPAARTQRPDPLDQVEAQELFRRGQQLAQMGDYVRAEQYLVAAMERGVTEAQVMPELMEVCVQSSRYSAALSYAEPYLAGHPEDWRLRQLVASILMGLGRPNDAVRELERVVISAPQEPLPYFLLGVIQRDHLSAPEVARERFIRYLELSPEGPHAAEAQEGVRLVDANTAAETMPQTEPSSDSQGISETPR